MYLNVKKKTQSNIIIVEIKSNNAEKHYGYLTVSIAE